MASEARRRIHYIAQLRWAVFELPGQLSAGPSPVMSDLFLYIPTYLAAESERARASQGRAKMSGPRIKKERPQNQKCAPFGIGRIAVTNEVAPP